MLVIFLQFAGLALAITAGMLVWFAVDQAEDPHDSRPYAAELRRALEEVRRDLSESIEEMEARR